ncbi:MAG TPA: glycoside hydrolase family 43 protein [Polyangia bacterium]|nr:glycoside hydrolase family 43 protein [Polyangia bacterium]
MAIPNRVRSGVAAALLALAIAGAASAADPPPRDERITLYRNPVLRGFHPDPSVVRVGSWFYLVNSSFEFFPGVPIYQSRDLVHWESLGHVLTRDSQLPLGGAGPSGGIFAPTIRHHGDTFYMITTNVSHGGSFFVTARNAEGPWSEPVWLHVPGGGIDPSLFFDDDGKVYLTSTGSAPGIYASQIDVKTGKLLTQPRIVWQGTGGRYPEGPHLYKVGGAYYLMISEGGTEYGHMVTIARARSPWGPFEVCPRNPILTHRNTPLSQPIQATGHADLVQDGEGNWWMVFLGIRPQGGYYWHHLGRETFLAPVRWDADGWPVVNEGKPIALEMHVRGLPESERGDDSFRPKEEFGGPALGPAWTFLRNPVRASYSTTERPGWLTLHPTAVPLDQEKGTSPTFVGRPQAMLRGYYEVTIDFAPGRAGEEAGLALYRSPHAHYELGVRRAGAGREVFVRQTVGRDLSTVTTSAPAPGSAPLRLVIEVQPTGYSFSWAPVPDLAHDKKVPRAAPLGTAETRLLATEVTGGFIGTMVGLYAHAPADDGSPTPAAFSSFFPTDEDPPVTDSGRIP